MKSKIRNITQKTILVIGDVMLDIYFGGEVNRISPEAPVPIFKKNNEWHVLGGASNVAANLVAANQKVSVMSMIGNDINGEKLNELFEEIGVDSSLIGVWDKPTVTKTRFLAENNQQILRLDIENRSPLSDMEMQNLLLEFKNVVEKFDLILISDYLKGLLTFDFTQEIINIANKYEKKVIVDVKDPEFKKYKGAWLLKPNIKELNLLTKMPVNTDDNLIEASRFLIDRVGCEYVLTTCGARGMILVSLNDVYKLDIVSKSVYDVTGAGDTVIAYLAASIANGLDIKDAVRIANYAAGIQVGKVGTSLIYLHEVEKAMFSEEMHKEKKIFKINEHSELIKQVKVWRNNGEKIVTTNGCFDIIHRGHISLIEAAKKYGDRLIVLINADNSVKRLKGSNRPINSENDRALVIAALGEVDAVVLFDPALENKFILDADSICMDAKLKKYAQEAPMGILKLIAPDIHIKGGDYNIEQVPEAMYAKEFKAVPFIEGYSTTNIINKK